MGANFRLMTDQSYAPGHLILQRTRNGTFENHHTYENPHAQQDTVLFQSGDDIDFLARSCGYRKQHCNCQTENEMANSNSSAYDYLSEITGDILPEKKYQVLAEYFGMQNESG